VTWTNGGENVVFIPVRYPLLSGVSIDCLLARRTDWNDLGDGLFEGLGQRMLVTDRDEYSLLQVRSIEMSD
jgi:type VI secretion system protein ImpE